MLIRGVGRAVRKYVHWDSTTSKNHERKNFLKRKQHHSQQDRLYIRPVSFVAHPCLYTMKNRRTLPHLFVFLCMACMAHTARPQAFIPDTLMRNWLNELIPGVVSPEGMMDTEHPGIADLDTLSIMFSSTPVPHPLLNLDGLQYLTSLQSFNLYIYQSIDSLVCDEFPSSLRTLVVHDSYTTGPIRLGVLPDEMDRLSLISEYSLYIIEQMPTHIGHLGLDLVQSIFWEGDCTVDELDLVAEVPWPYDKIVIPPITVESMDVYAVGGFFKLDLSSTSVSELDVEIADSLFMPTDVISFKMNYVNFIDGLPSSIIEMDLGMVFHCLPALPDGLTSLDIFSYGYDCLPNWPASLNEAYINSNYYTINDATFCSILNSECPGPYPGVAGRVFVDENTNGLYDSGEPGLQQSTVVLQPSGHSVGVNAQGEWQFGIPPGNYTITAASTYPYVGSINPTNHTADVPNMGDTDVGNDFAATVIPGIEDLRAFINAEVTRPGFENRLFLACNNYGTEPVDAILTLDFDNDQSWVGSSVAPTSLTGNIATWDLGTLAMGTTVDLTVDLYTDPAVPLGTPIQHTLTSNPVAGDETPADNIALWTDSVIGSYDPNDKLISPATLTAAQVAAGVSPINYTIRFQNTGTYLAERVVILDTLPEGLVLESIQFLASSHDNHWYVTDGVLHVIHNDIMLPDSTSDEPNSHGYVMFRILPSTDLVEGQQILNIAHIVFDFNEPIITPPAVFTVQTPTNVDDHAVLGTMVYPNPVRDLLWISDNSGADTPYQIRDVHGRRVQQGTFTRRRPTAVHALEPGVYVIELLATDGVRSLRFVKE